MVGLAGLVGGNSCGPDGVALQQQAIDGDVRRGGHGDDPEAAVAGVIDQESGVPVGAADDDGAAWERLGGALVGRAEHVGLLGEERLHLTGVLAAGDVIELGPLHQP